MTTILISDQPFSERAFQSTFGESLKELQAVGKDGIMWPYGIYTLGKTSAYDNNIINCLSGSCIGDAQNLYNICDTLGEETAVAVSQTSLMLRDSLIAASGASAGLFTARTNKFVRAAGQYQTALTEFRETVRVQKRPGGDAAKKVKVAFDAMNKHFNHELQLANNGRNSKQRAKDPLNNHQRAMNIARSSRHIKRLELTNDIEARAIGQFSKAAKVIGKGIIVLDLGVRAYDVNNVREAGGDWERAAFVESIGFTASAVTSIGIVAGAALIFTAMTPVGWVAIIVTTATASLWMNGKGKEFGESVYDDVRRFMGFK